MARKHFEWKVRDKLIQLGERTLIVGVLNVTPDSFSDGGKYTDPDRAFARAVEMEEEGADFIDIGAESTRPGSVRISEAEELRRLVPVLKRLRNKLTVPICVDTYKSGGCGKSSGAGRGYHQRPQRPDHRSGAGARGAAGGRRADHQSYARHAGDLGQAAPLKNPLRDYRRGTGRVGASRGGRGRGAAPHRGRSGAGFRQAQGTECGDSGAAGRVGAAGAAVDGGPSRKHFLARETALETEFAGAAAVTAAILYGVHMVRVHDVKSMKAVVEVADEIAKARFDAAATVVGTAGSNVSRVGPR